MMRRIKLRGRSDKVGAVLPGCVSGHRPGAGTPHSKVPWFAGCGPMAFPAHVMMRQSVQFRLHQWNQSLERAVVSATPIREQSSHFLL